MSDRLVLAAGEVAVWGVALSGLDGPMEVVEFARYSDVVPFVSAAYGRDDVAEVQVFELASGYVVQPDWCANGAPFVTFYPRRGGRWLAVYPDETSDVLPTFEALPA